MYVLINISPYPKNKKRKYSSTLLPEHTTMDSVTGVSFCPETDSK
jgi:hypothetical protein